MCIGQNSKIESSLIETAPIKRWVLSVEVVLWRHGHLVSPDGRPPYRAPPCYGAMAREPIWLVLQLCTVDGVTLLHWWCCTVTLMVLAHFWNRSICNQMCFQCGQSSLNYSITVWSEFYVWIWNSGRRFQCMYKVRQPVSKSSLWEFVSFSEQNRLSRSDSTWGDKTEGSTLFSREGSRRACR